MKLGKPLKVKYLSIGQEYKPSRHEANDFGLPTAKAGTPTQAEFNGIVLRDSSKAQPWNKEYGYIVKNEKYGYFTFHNHCVPTVKIGTRVKRGQVIGKIDTVTHQNILRKKWGASPLKKGDAHIHHEIHPTGKWSRRDDSMCYFDRKEVKYVYQNPGWPTDYSNYEDRQLQPKISKKENDMYKEKYEQCKKIKNKEMKMRVNLQKKVKTLEKELKKERNEKKELQNRIMKLESSVKTLKKQFKEQQGVLDTINTDPLILFITKIKSWLKRKQSKST